MPFLIESFDDKPVPHEDEKYPAFIMVYLLLCCAALIFVFFAGIYQIGKWIF